MAFKLDDKILSVGVPFTSNGINYPANWLRLTTLSEKKAIGITEVADSTTYDQRFYTDEGKAKALSGLKTDWISQQKASARSFLGEYDWYITRKLEEGKDIPGEVSRYRDDVRTVCAARETQISNCIDVTSLKALADGAYDTDGKKISGFTSWPTKPS